MDQKLAKKWLATHVRRCTRPLFSLHRRFVSSKVGQRDAECAERIFLNDTIHEPQIVDEAKTADEMCRILWEPWGDRLDGILRMDIGTEIILCSFEKNLEFVRAVRAKPIKSLGKGNR